MMFLLSVTIKIALLILVALGASTLHLGRPVHAYRAIRMWRRSWLSREVLAFSAFSAVAALYAGMLWFGVPGSVWLGALTTAFGAAGVGVALQKKSPQTQALWMAAYGVGAGVGVLLPFSREQESEADRLGLIFAAMAGYDPHEAVPFWQRMAAAAHAGSRRNRAAGPERAPC